MTPDSDSLISENRHIGQIALIRGVFYAFIFGIGFFLSFNQAMKPRIYHSDLFLHLNSAKQFTLDKLLSHSHPGFNILVSGFSKILHVSHECVAVFLFSFSLVLLAYVINRILAVMLNRQYSEEFLLFVTLSLMLVTAIYMPFFNRYVYYGQSSPNVWHNPTILLSKPFAYVVFCLFPFLLCDKEKRSLKCCVLASVMLIICTVIKPSFIIVFLPAAGLYILLRHIKSLQAYVRMFILFCPVVILLIVQYANTYNSQSEAGIGIVFLKHMGLRTPNIFISFLLVSAFPLCTLLFLPVQNFKNNHLFLAWLMFIVALIQRAFLVETGERMAHGNFGWGYQLALQMLFVFCMVELLRWLKQADYQNCWVKIRVFIITMIFSLHFVSGVFYLGRNLAGKGYR